MQPTQTQDLTAKTAGEFFRSAIAHTVNARTAASLRQSLGSFEHFTSPGELTFADFSEPVLSGWLASLFAEGYTPKTAAYYLKNLSALYSKAVSENLASETDAFSRLRVRIQNISSATATAHHPFKDIAKKIQHLAAKSANPGESNLADDITLFAILGGLSTERLAYYKKDEYTGQDPALGAIVRKYSHPRRKFLFPLRQSERTPRQLDRQLTAMFSKALREVKVDLPAHITDIPGTIWSALAREICSIDSGAVIACLGRRPDRSPAYDFAATVELTDDEKEFIYEEIRTAVTDNPARWFAMRLRPGISYEKLTERLSQDSASRPELYYPSEEIARKSGRRIIYENKPVVPGLIFFRTAITAIPALFHRIGDLAWCYRHSSGYAVIPNAEMEIFRCAIGSLGPETEIHPLGSIPLEKGDRVEIIGGSFMGREAIFTSTHTPSAGRNAGKTVYRLRLLDNNGIEWTVDTAPTLVRKSD